MVAICVTGADAALWALTDAPAMLWRLQLAAPRPVTLAWEPVHATAVHRLTRPSAPYVELHCLLALAGAGDVDGLDRWLHGRRATEDPRSRATAWPQLGFLELEAGYADSAASALEQAVGIQPGDFRLWSALGEAYRLSGRVGEAADAWRRSLDLNPEQPRLRQSLGVLEQAG